MRWLTGVLWLWAAIAIAADDDELRVLTGPPQSLLYSDLLAQVEQQSQARAQAVAEALRSTDGLLQRAEKLRVQYADMLGRFPARTPLEAHTLGTIQCDGYRIERVVFASRPRHRVTANLYLPDGVKDPVPGVLVPCGHSDNGKASGPYQSVCILLALHGCAALIYDPIGQGERHQLRGIERHGTTEHTLVGQGALLVGRNTAHYRVWDGLRAMDYLAGRSEVDGARLGCTGNSGGGTLTTWLMAVDPRIKVAAPSCFITTLPRLFETIGPQDCEQHFPAQGAYGIDHTDFLTMRAPRPTLILAAEQDFFDFAGTRQAYVEAERVFRALGQADHMGLFSFDDKHGFSQPRRQAAVAWMLRWLADDARPVVELTLALQADADLQVTRSGQVLDEFADERTVVDFNQAHAAELAAARAGVWQAMDESARRATIRQALMLPAADGEAPTVSKVGELKRAGLVIERLLILRPGQVPLPALCYSAEALAEGKRVPGVLVVDGSGKSSAAAQAVCERRAKEGVIVLAVDLRGYGETADLPDKRQYLNDEFRTAMLAMHVGRPLLGQRVSDLLAARRVLAADTRVDAHRIELLGRGRAATAALHAAALEGGFSGVALDDALGSWTESVVAQPLKPGLMGEVVPGVLAHYDLADLRDMLGARLRAWPRD